MLMNNNTDDATPHANNEDNIQLTNQANKEKMLNKIAKRLFRKEIQSSQK